MIVTDIQMPGLNGLELSSKIKEFAEEKQFETSIIVCSADISGLKEIDYKVFGIDYVMSKPLRTEKFKDILGKILRSRDK